MTDPSHDLLPDRELAVASAAAADRAALAAVLALDQRFGAIVRAARDPLVGQMRLTWWHDALTRLDTAPAPPEPLLQALARHVVSRGVEGQTLAALVEGWEAVLEGLSAGAGALDAYAEARGGALFVIAGGMLRADRPAIATAGRGWALADLATHSSDPAIAAAARDRASQALRDAFASRWHHARPLGLLALLARLELGERSPLAKSLIVTRFRLTGR